MARLNRPYRVAPNLVNIDQECNKLYNDLIEDVDKLSVNDRVHLRYCVEIEHLISLLDKKLNENGMSNRVNFRTTNRFNDDLHRIYDKAIATEKQILGAHQ